MFKPEDVEKQRERLQKVRKSYDFLRVAFEAAVAKYHEYPAVKEVIDSDFLEPDFSKHPFEQYECLLEKLVDIRLKRNGYLFEGIEGSLNIIDTAMDRVSLILQGGKILSQNQDVVQQDLIDHLGTYDRAFDYLYEEEGMDPRSNDCLRMRRGRVGDQLVRAEGLYSIMSFSEGAFEKNGEKRLQKNRKKGQAIQRHHKEVSGIVAKMVKTGQPITRQERKKLYGGKFPKDIAKRYKKTSFDLAVGYINISETEFSRLRCDIARLYLFDHIISMQKSIGLPETPQSEAEKARSMPMEEGDNTLHNVKNLERRAQSYLNECAPL